MGALYFAAIFNVLGALVLCARYTFAKLPAPFWNGVWVVSTMLSFALTELFSSTTYGVWIPLSVSVFWAICARFFIPVISSFGVGLLSVKFSLPVAVLIFLHQTLQQIELSGALHIAIYILLGLYLLVAVFNALVEVLSDLSGFTIKHPKRDTALTLMEACNSEFGPKISIHIPCYAEPPHLVIATLDAVSNIEYGNFEVLVIDNNTKDPDLWKPVEEHCLSLGSRFRFYHVDPIFGAKAGAINFALKQTVDDAEIIVVIDADYIVKPGFIKRYLPLFENKMTGFVQTSHEYREWRGNSFLRGVYYHYVTPHKTTHPALNEYGTGYLVGTVCMIRRRLLDELGGWAEWALTEDLELAMRIMTKGYVGHVFADGWGAGLIPETLEGIKKQQFRWWAGANQEFRVNWRRYLGVNNDYLTISQRGMRVYATFKDCISACVFLVDAFVLFVCVSLMMNDQVIHIPGVVLGLLGASLIAKGLKVSTGVRELGGRGVRDYMLTLLVKGSLRWIGVKAFVVPLFQLKITWVRTDKFKQSGSLVRALNSSFVETTIALVYFLCAVAIFPFAGFKEIDFLAVAFIWFLIQGSSFMCTLVIAILSEHELRPDTLDEPKILKV